jgi:hypothetical protein
MKLWEALVRNLPPKNSEGVPDSPREYTLEYHPKLRGEKSIFRRLTSIRFSEDEEVKASSGSL